MRSITAFALGVGVGVGVTLASNATVEYHRVPVGGVPSQVDDEFHAELMKSLGMDPEDPR